jgi:hypothetical protein
VLVIWLVPFLGAVIAYKDLDWGWFKKKRKKKKCGWKLVVAGVSFREHSSTSPI